MRVKNYEVEEVEKRCEEGWCEVSIIVKLSDGSRIRVKGVNSEEQLKKVCDRILLSREVESTEQEWDKEQRVQGVVSGGYSDWRQVYNEEIRRGLNDGGKGGRGRKNEPTGKSKDRKLVTNRKWRRGGGGYDYGE